VIAQRPAQRRDHLVEIVLLDHDVRPNRRDERRLVEELPWVLHHEVQRIERLRGELDRSAVAACGQPPLRSEETEVAELVDAVSAAFFSHFPPVSRGFRRSQAAPKASSGLLEDSRLRCIAGPDHGDSYEERSND